MQFSRNLFISSYESLVVTHAWLAHAQCEGRSYLPWLTHQLRSLGARFELGRRLGSLAELAGGGQYDVVVNCAGIGSYDLLGDREVGRWAGRKRARLW